MLCGMTGSGKTTFAIQYLLNVAAACRFIFDDLGQMAARLKLPQASTSAELEASLASRWVVFNPHRMFPGDAAAAFRFFCQWAFDCSRRGPGKKVFLADEIWRWCSPHAIPRELAVLAQMGRSEELELMTATQLPHRINASISGQCSELICFRLDETLALDKIRELRMDPDEVRDLPLGKFIAKNRLSGGRLDGTVF
jgi:hypothetical protein